MRERVVYPLRKRILVDDKVDVQIEEPIRALIPRGCRLRSRDCKDRVNAKLGRRLHIEIVRNGAYGEVGELQFPKHLYTVGEISSGVLQRFLRLHSELPQTLDLGLNFLIVGLNVLLAKFKSYRIPVHTLGLGEDHSGSGESIEDHITPVSREVNDSLHERGWEWTKVPEEAVTPLSLGWNRKPPNVAGVLPPRVVPFRILDPPTFELDGLANSIDVVFERRIF